MHAGIRRLERHDSGEFLSSSFDQYLLSLPVKISHPSKMPNEMTLGHELGQHGLCWSRGVKSGNGSRCSERWD
jgi:hypothetical protein